MPKTLDRVAELRRALTTKTTEIDAITDAWEVTGEGKVILNDDQSAAYLKAVAEANSIKQLIDAQTGVRRIRAWLDEPEGTPAAGLDAAATARGRMAGKSIGEQFLDSDDWTEFKTGGFRGRMAFTTDATVWSPTYDAYGSKDVFSLSAGTMTVQGLGSMEQRPLTERLPRRIHIRDLFPADTTEAAVIYGVRQTGFVNAARPVPERTAADGTLPPSGGVTDVFGRAPRSRITFATVTYPVANVSHVEYAHNTILEDDPRLRGLLNRQMVEGVRLAEDDQVLFGDGAGANIRGVFNTTGVQTYNQPPATGNPPVTSEKKVATLRKAITRVQLAEMSPTGIVINPLDWQDLELETDAQGRYLLVANVATGAEERAWRLPVVPTTAMPQGRYLLGAFGLGAQLFDRRQVEVTVSTENMDLFERDAITVKGSERIALTVDRPEAFVQGTLVAGE